MKVVEQGTQLWIIGTVGASESSHRLINLGDEHPLLRLGICQPFIPKYGSFANEISIQIRIAQHTSVCGAPTRRVQLGYPPGVVWGRVSNLHKELAHPV